MVTRPDLVGCLYCRWLPFVATKYQPSARPGSAVRAGVEARVRPVAPNAGGQALHDHKPAKHLHWTAVRQGQISTGSRKL